MQNELSRQIGSRLKTIRTEKKLTQESFSEFLKIKDSSSYRKIERGTKNLSLNKLNEILILLKLTPHEFFNSEEFINSNDKNYSTNNLINKLSIQEDREELIDLFLYIIDRKNG